MDQLGGLFETDHQPGSGSWDDFSAALNKQARLWSFGANALYAHAGAGSQDTRLGDRLSYAVSAAYQIWSQDSRHHDAMHLGAGFEGMMRHGGADHATPSGPKIALDLSLGLSGQ